MNRLRSFIANIPGLSSAYHYALALLGALLYRFPSKKMTIIGVTGTKGKTTTSNLIAQILESAEHKTGLATTVLFRIGDKEWPNGSKQTMLGRFGLQKLLRQMADAGCEYAVIETSSEGILQHRHRFIDYKIAVFTNLSPEHIERHGSFENYRETKVGLFEEVAKRTDGIGIYNLDDNSVSVFLEPGIRTKFGFAAKVTLPVPDMPPENQMRISDIELSENGSRFKMASVGFETPLLGEFNIYNAAAAACAALALKIPVEAIKKTLADPRPTPGRFEVLESKKGFKVIIDYAHEPASLEAAYEAVKLFKPKRVIGILGAQGGGRDKWKREAMGKIAAAHCDKLMLTNEDPYEEDPENIVKDIEKGTSGGRAVVVKILNRKDAIKEAISEAQRGDAVVLTGKGGEVWMCVKDGKKVPWNEKKLAEEALKK